LHGDIETLHQQLAQARAASRSSYMTMGSDVERPRFLTWQEHAEEQRAYHEDRENVVRRGADRLARCLRKEVRMKTCQTRYGAPSK
jgi:hypothetical protein